MELHEALRVRHSVRAFQPTPVADAVLARVVTAALESPSWANTHLDAGLFLQSFLLAAAAEGLGTCAQASLASYPRGDSAPLRRAVGLLAVVRHLDRLASRRAGKSLPAATHAGRGSVVAATRVNAQAGHRCERSARMSELIQIAGPEAGVVRLTLNRPDKKNALSIALRDEITAALAGLAENDAVKVVIVTGAGDTFSAGFDLAEFQQLAEPARARELWASSDRFHRALLEYPLPTIAAVNGPALAGGFDLAVLCDLRIASTKARFAHVEQSFGDVVYAPLHELVGGAVARDLCLTGRRIDAAEALALRLVSAVVAPEALDDEVARWAAQITRAPRELLLHTRVKIMRRAQIAFTTTLDL